jgi:hypothetical protein
MSLTDLFNQTITIASKTGYNEYGRETTSGATAIQSRFQKTNKQRLLPNGSMITIVATVYVPSDTVVVVDDKVTYGGNTYKVYGIYTAVDGTGATNHLKLELTKWKAV